jgi:hypothetical protein
MRTLFLISVFILAGCQRSGDIISVLPETSVNPIDFTLWNVTNVDSVTSNSITEEQFWIGDVWNKTTERLTIRWQLKRYFYWQDLAADVPGKIYDGQFGLVGGVDAPAGKWRYRLVKEFSFLPAKEEDVPDGYGLKGYGQLFLYIPYYIYNPRSQYPFTRISLEVFHGTVSKEYRWEGSNANNLRLSDFAIVDRMQN